MASSAAWLALLVLLTLTAVSMAQKIPSRISDSRFSKNYMVSWGSGNTQLLNKGYQLQLQLRNKTGGAGFASRSKYLFGFVSMRIKLVPGDSAGTVTTFYMSSEMPSRNHDEIDFEFLGNRTGQPYIVHTNVFANGTGDREQQIYLWFDPTADFHTYSILWNRQRIIFYVDDVPIRVYWNRVADGVPFPLNRPMGVYSSLWNGDDWATRGGLEKIDWESSPFTAAFRGFGIDACKFSKACFKRRPSRWWESVVQDEVTEQRLQWVRDNFMVYDYCRDVKRFSVMPPECT